MAIGVTAKGEQKRLITSAAKDPASSQPEAFRITLPANPPSPPKG